MAYQARVPADRRKAPRFHVRFRSSLATDGKRVVGDGLVTDLSTGGCKIESQIPVSKGIYLELRLYGPGLSHPIIIEGAPVRWVRKPAFGVEFIRLTRGAQARLRHSVQCLRELSGLRAVERHGEEDCWVG
ncbi:MAG TPA: PilZ domain-containing protein [Nitrospiraceae bacterium]|nr:PilZ domain-containing protein [Nitrospiraceae bacterium]